MVEEKTNYTFKTLSAIGIILVICGHFGCTALSVGNLFKYDSFHMPLFVFISGYFFKTSNYSSCLNVIKYIKKKVVHLVIPYLMWNFVYGVVAYVLHNNSIYSFEIGSNVHFSIDTLFIQPFRLGDGFQYNVAAWFLGTLFLVEIIHCIIKYFFSKVGINSEYLFGIFFLIIGGYAIILAQSSWESTWKICLTRVMYLGFWYEFGLIYKQYIEQWDNKISAGLKIIAAVLASGFIILSVGKNDIPVIYTSTFPNSPVFTITRGFLGIMFWLAIAKGLSPIIAKSKVVLYIANHTFSLMMHQGIVGLGLNMVVLVLNHKLGIFPGFDEERFRHVIWYAYTRDGLSETHILNVVLIVALILICIFLYERYIKVQLQRIFKQNK